MSQHGGVTDVSHHSLGRSDSVWQFTCCGCHLWKCKF